MVDWIISILLLLGSFLMLIASIGIYRFPDLFTRMQASTKASSLGVGLMLFAAILYFQNTQVTIVCVATIGFVFLTAPVAAHLIARVAYALKTPLWSGTIIDELEADLGAKEKPLETKTETEKPAPKKAPGSKGSRVSDIFKGLRGKKID